MTVNRKFAWLKALMVAEMPDKAKLVGVQIFNYSDGNGFNSHPGYERLSNDLGFSQATVKRNLKVLREEGWIVKTKSSNATGIRRFADTYALHLSTSAGHLEDPRLEAIEGQNDTTEGQWTPDRGSPGRPTNTSFPSNHLHQARSWADTPLNWEAQPGISSGGWKSQWKNFGKVPD